MDDSQKRKSRLELGHVLFIDIAGYSKITTEEESEALPKLTLRRSSSAKNDDLIGEMESHLKPSKFIPKTHAA